MSELPHPDDVRMTFGEHLDELRSRLLKVILVLLLFAAGALAFQEQLLAFFKRPYDVAVGSIVERRQQAFAEEETGSDEPPAPVPSDDLTILTEVVGQLVVLGAEPQVAADLRERIEEARRLREEEAALEAAEEIGSLHAVSVTEVFFAHIKVALLTAAVAATPVFLYQMWQFIGAGLYASERTAVLRILPLSLLLFAVGLAFAFQILVPVGLDFLLDYADPDVIQPMVTVQSYLNLLFVLLLLMGVVFQVPLVMTVVTRMGLVQPRTFREKRKYFLLGAFIVAALLTPPDYVTQLLVAVPMVVLFELGIFLSMLTARGRPAPDEPESAA